MTRIKLDSNKLTVYFGLLNGNHWLAHVWRYRPRRNHCEHSNHHQLPTVPIRLYCSLHFDHPAHESAVEVSSMPSFVLGHC